MATKESKANKPSKASVAREFMKKIGVFSKNPPENWVAQVEDHLKQQGFTLPASGRVQIYSIRSKAMKKDGKPSSAFVKGKKKVPGTIHQVSIEDLSSAKKYAAANGGITKCIEALKALQILSIE